MKNMVITQEVPIEFTSKTSITGVFHDNNKTYVGISLKYGTSVLYGVETYPDGSKMEMIHANYACRATDNGVQYYDSYMWKFFDDSVQEAYSNYLAEKELLEK